MFAYRISKDSLILKGQRSQDPEDWNLKGVFRYHVVQFRKSDSAGGSGAGFTQGNTDIRTETERKSFWCGDGVATTLARCSSASLTLFIGSQVQINLPRSTINLIRVVLWSADHSLFSDESPSVCRVFGGGVGWGCCSTFIWQCPNAAQESNRERAKKHKSKFLPVRKVAVVTMATENEWASTGKRAEWVKNLFFFYFTKTISSICGIWVHVLIWTPTFMNSFFF